MHIEVILLVTRLRRVPASLLLDAATIPYPLDRVVKVVRDSIVRSYHECMESVVTKPLTTAATATAAAIATTATSRPSLPLTLVQAARAVGRIGRIAGEGEHRTLRVTQWMIPQIQ